MSRDARREDLRLLTGQACFVADVRLPDMLEAAFVRSPSAHAVIRSIDVAEARRSPGVVAVVTGADLESVRQLPDLLRMAHPVHQFPLATGKVRYAGAPLAAVVANDRYLAEDAAELVFADLDELPSVASIDAALAPGAVRLYDDWPDNRLVQTSFDPAVDAIFASAARIVAGDYASQRQAPMPMETRGVVAEFRGGRLTVWTSSQIAHQERTILARVLGMPESDIQVIAPDVGGGFGGKLHIYAEDMVVAHLAMALGRPVRWIEDRREHFLASDHAREQRHHIEAALDAAGTILALRCALITDMGSGEITPPGISPSFVSAASLTGPYRIPAAATSVTCVVTNKTPAGAYRGFGTPEMVFALERLLDKVAQETRRDPIELRRSLLLRPEDLPYTTALGRRIDSGTHLEAYERAVQWARETAAQHAAGKGKRIGVGFASYLEGIAASYIPTSGIFPAYEMCRLTITPDGQVVVASGLGPMGQGIETMLVTLASRALCVTPESVRVVVGDTDRTPYGLGSFSSRSTVVAAGAIEAAASVLRSKIARIAAHLLGVAVDELTFDEGVVRARGPQAAELSIAEIAEVAYHYTFRLPPDVEPGLEALGTFDPPIDHFPTPGRKPNICLSYANTSHAAVVEVDVETGETRLLDYLAVHDAGPLLNPAIVEGQVHGGIAQGIAGALFEELVYSEDGQPLVTSFMDYLVPTAADMPAHLSVHHLESYSPVTPLGLKGVGESGTAGPPAAIANAVCDALADLNIDITETPITPSRLRALIRVAQEAR